MSGWLIRAKKDPRILPVILLLLMFASPGDAAAACDVGPTPASPQGNISDAQPVFSWTGDSACTWYQLYLTNASDTPGALPWITATDANCGGDTSCETTIPQGLSAGTHTWWVRGWSPETQSTPWSALQTFNIDNVCAVKPTSTAPRDSINNTIPTFRWVGSSACTWYLLTLRDSNGSLVYQPYVTSSYAQCNTDTNCEVTPQVTLGSGSYTWTVQGWNPSEGNGQINDPMSFQVGTIATDCDSTPSPVGPAGNYVGVTPTFSWERSDGCTWYRLWLSGPAGETVYLPWVTTEEAGCTATGSTCQLAPSIALEGGNHRWWVTGWNENTGYTSWSNQQSFLVDDNCPLCPPPPPES